MAAVAYIAGGALLALEAAVHIQQYAAILHEVRWVGPLFLANAFACAVVVAGLAVQRTRAAAAFAGSSSLSGRLEASPSATARASSAGTRAASERRWRSL